MSELLDWAAAEIKRRFELRTKQTLQPLSGNGGWWPIVREPYPGAWQRNDEIVAESVLTFSAVFACVTLISSDIGKLCLRLVEKDADGVWSETESPAFSPVLRKPNRFQTIVKFVESWLISKLTQGNTYVLKQRDQRGVVVAMYVLDPLRVTPLVAGDGSVYYECKRDDLSGLSREVMTIPASEIIHDRDACLYHDLMGVSRITAAGLAALQGMAIQSNSKTLFSQGAVPGGILTAPGNIPQDAADRIKAYWDTNFSGENAGKVAVLGNDLKFERIPYNAVDMQLIDQLNWTGKNVCTAFHVPAFMVGIGDFPPYGQVGSAIQQYYSQCLQTLIVSFETCLDDGLGLTERISGKQYGTELDIDDLIWMDAEARTKAGAEAIKGSLLSINEARRRYLSAPSVKGGESILSQQQYFSIEALAERDASDPFAKPTPAPAPAAAPAQTLEQAASYAAAIHRKALEVGLYAA